MNAELTIALERHRHRHPEITEQQALADLWRFGCHCAETFAAAKDELLDAEDRRHNVIKHPDQFAGWHVGWVEAWKPGVFKFFATRSIGNEIEAIHGFCGIDVIRVAIETHVIAKPNGYTMP